ncbi:MAG: transglutaminase domain-containing protein, partial [Candidatus Eremiobacteraeota bacterium]|nr:transglutaminase domain-containing protein [Candidatus Eremiobacteraeota bacterium]
WVLCSLTQAHEEGYISRPLALVDPLWSSGIDPLPVLIAFGVVIVSLLLQLAASHTRKRGRWLDLAILTILLLALFTLFPSQHLKDLKPAPPTVSAAGQGEEQNQDDEGLDFSDPDQGDSQDRPVAVVLFNDEYQPQSGFYYFRESAFSLYNGTKMVTDTSGRYDRDAAADFPTSQPVEIELPPLSGGLRRPLQTRVVLLEEHHQPFGLTNPSGFAPEPNPDPKRFQSAYTAFSWVLDRPFSEVMDLPVGDSSWDAAAREHYTAAPDDPRYARLLATILADQPQASPLQKALAIKLWLDTNGIYSQSSTHADSDQPVADFLFGDRTGYCVFFAHAAVYLMRTAGLPARVGAGYAVASQQRGRGSALLVPASSSHAWPEIYVEGAGWVVLDVSPEQNLDPPRETQQQDLNQLLGEMARATSPQQKKLVRFDLQEMAARLIGRLLAGLRWLLLAGLAGFYLVKLWRRLRPAFCQAETLPTATLIAVLDRLAETGLQRRTGEPRQRFAERCRAISPTFAELTRAHLAHQMGAPEKRLPVPWRELLARAGAEWKANTPWR